MKKIIIILMTVVTLPLGVSASQVSVSATAYSADSCRYYSTSLTNMRFNLVDNIPWGSHVFLRYGFHDSFSNQDWTGGSEVEMTAIAPDTWDALVQKVQVDSRGGSYFTEVQFDIKVVSADGAAVYDNGGALYGFYRAELPNRTCQSGELEPLNVSVMYK